MVIRISCRYFLVESRYLFGELGHAIRSVVHILIGGEQFDRIDRHVDSCSEHLYLFTIFIINSVDVLRHSPRKCGLFVLDKREL